MVRFFRGLTPSSLSTKGFLLRCLLFNPFASFEAIFREPPARHSTLTTLWYSPSSVATTTHMIYDTRQRELRYMMGLTVRC